MERRTSCLSLMMVLTVAIWGGAASNLFGDESAPEARFQIGVATDRTTYARGEPVEIAVTVANPDGWLVECTLGCSCCWYELRIVDNTGQGVAYEMDDVACPQIPYTFSWPAYETRITGGTWWQTVGGFEFGGSEGDPVPAGEYWVQLDWPGVTVVRSQKFTIAEPEAALPRAWVLPAAVYTEGVNDTFWSTDVLLTNPGTTDSVVTMSLFLHGTADGPIVHNFVLPAGQSDYRHRILPRWFQVEGVGHLHISTVGGEVIVEGRVLNGRNTDDGVLSQRIDAVPVEQGMDTAVLTGLHHSADGNLGYRSNIGILNLSGDSLSVDVELYGSFSTAPTATPVGTIPLELPPFGSWQLTDIYRLVVDEWVVSGSAIVRLSEFENGSFTAYASVVDNQTGDAIFVPARRCGH